MPLLSEARSPTAALARPEPDMLVAHARLHDIAKDALAHAAELDCAAPVDGAPDDLAALTGALEVASRRVADAICAGAPPAPLTDLVGLLVSLGAAHRELRESRLRLRLDAVSRVQRGLDQLRSADRPAELLNRVAEAACVSCGFSRCVVSRISGSDWIIERTHFVDDPEGAATYLAAVGGRRVALERSLLETELVRRREPVVVHDAQGDPRTSKQIVAPARTTSYVGAPILSGDRVIGLVHADHGADGRGVDTLDRDALAAFTEGVGVLYERSVLRAQLAAQRDQVRRLATSTGVLLDDLCDAEIEFTPPKRRDAAVGKGGATLFPRPQSGLDSLLTRREIEVLDLIATGDGNRTVAEKLFITEGTVKTHVKHILRKLHASNRAEAIARYLHALLDQPGVTS